MKRNTIWRMNTMTGMASALLLVLGSVLAGSFSPALASHGNTLIVNPTSGLPGIEVALSGTGWTQSNGPYLIFWDKQGGLQLGTFLPNTKSAWSMKISLPKDAPQGAHQIIACEGFGTEFQDCIQVNFTVLAFPTNTPIPTNTPLPTNTPRPTNTTSFLPTIAPLPQITLVRPTQLVPNLLLPTPVGSCSDLGLSPDADVLDFEESLAVQETRYGVSFEGSGEVVNPSVATRSGTHALRGQIGMEFGSIGLPVRMVFSRPVSALGMFIGMENALYSPGPISATLTAWGYAAGGTDIIELGRDHVDFPAAPTAIRYCLRVQAGDGQTITRAELEYRDASGLSTFESRLMDDLTLVASNAELPADRPPRIEIVHPSTNGVTVRSYDSYSAQVTEDRSLRRMWYQVDGSTPVDVGFWHMADPTRYETFLHLNLSGGPHSIIFGAEDNAGQQATDNISVNVPYPPPPVDIEAVAAEAVQVVQCLGEPGCRDNSVPLIANKPTLVRLYLSLRGGDVLSGPVYGRLCNVGFGLCVSSTNSILPDVDPDPVANDRANINATLNFLLPAGWIPGRSTLDLTASVNDYHAVTEMDYTNNSVTMHLSVLETRVMKVNFIPVSVAGVSAPLDERTNMADWLESVYPVTTLQIVSARSRTPLTVAAVSNSSGDGCGVDWNRMMSALDTRRNLDLSAGLIGADVHYAGMIAQGVDTGGILGCGFTPGWDAASIITPGQRFGGEVLAQELAHNIGLNHAPGCGAGGLDPSYPVADGTLDGWGMDVGRLQIYQPSTTFDYMGYCGGEANTWTSRYVYFNMIRSLPTTWLPSGGGRSFAPARQSGEPQEYLVLGGVVYPDKIDLVSGPYHMTLLAQDDTPPGPFSVEIQDQTGATLYLRDFRAAALSNSDAPDVGTFYLTLPVLEGAQTILFRYQGDEISRLAASASPPSVKLLSPTGGESWDVTGPQTIRWNAQDPDGDPLLFTLQASDDNGGRWVTLAMDLTGVDSFQVDAADLAGGDYILRVLASDGFHTAEDRTATTIHVGSKPPTVQIMAPADGTTFPVGEMAVLQGFASDLEDGVVPEDVYRWTSDIDGELGQSSTLWALSLSPGEHNITLTVTDKSGLNAQASVHIVVLGSTTREETASPTPRPPELLFLLIFLGLGGLVVGVTGILWLTLRRRKGL